MQEGLAWRSPFADQDWVGLKIEQSWRMLEALRQVEALTEAEADSC